MRTCVLLICLACLLPGQVIAQISRRQALIDSLEAIVPKIREDSGGVRVLWSLSQHYRQMDPDKGIVNADKALALSRKIGWKKGQAAALSSLAAHYSDKSAYPQAMDYALQSLRLYEELGNKGGVATAYIDIGHVYWGQSNGVKALEYEQKGLQMAYDLHDTGRQLQALVNIGAAYQVLGSDSLMVRYYEQALHLAEASRNESSVMSLNSDVANALLTQHRYSEALAYGYKALNAGNRLGNRQHHAIITGNLGIMYYMLATDSARQTPADSLVLPTRAANLSRAISFLQKGIAACLALHYYVSVPSYAATLANALEQRGDYRGAMEALKQYIVIKDSVYSVQNTEQVATLENKRIIELKDKDLQIARLALAKRHAERIFFTGGIAVLLLVAGLLFRSFRLQQRTNRLLAKEKRRSDDLLLNILPAEVAEELKDAGRSAARQYAQVTVLFTDFVDFTGMSERLGAGELVQELHECFTAFDAIIERHGLEKIKTIGDAYMAVCGLPTPDARHAQKSVAAAIGIMNFIEERNARGGIFRLRIGINSGPVVAGIVGVKKFAFDIWGDTVNTAARMEQHSEPGRINISQVTYDLVKEEFPCSHRGRIAAKHKGEIDMYFVEGAWLKPAEAWEALAAQ